MVTPPSKREKVISKARFAFRWDDQLNLGVATDKARDYPDEMLSQDGAKPPTSAVCAAPLSAGKSAHVNH